MLAKKERLTRNEFDRFFSSGKRHHSPFFQLIVAPSDAFHGAAVVGKKVAKRAVDRNRIRRQLYGVLYAFRRRSPLPCVLIVIAKPPSASLPRKERADALRELLLEAL
jgi:ribonuclease P protein component